MTNNALSKRKRWIAATLLSVFAALGIGQAVLQNKAEAQREMVQAPQFEVDPLWPKPLPNGWLLGMAIGVWVDEQDHVWMIHRSSATLHNNEKGAELNPPIAECCKGAPPVLRFEPGHPDADKQGYVAYPQVDPIEEMTDLLGAVRAYELNASAVQATKGMITQSQDLLR